MREPLVSFLMPTYGRIATQKHLVEDCLYGFTQQDYRNKELVILNHAPRQTIVCDVPGVRVYNWHDLPSLGKVMQTLVSLANGEYCLPCEDDDASLPWRASQAVEMLAPGYDYWNPGLWWYWQRGQDPVPDGKGVGHNCSAYRREAFKKAYPNFTKGHDAHADSYAQSRLRCNLNRLTDPKDAAYFYNFAVSQIHLGATGDMEATYRSMSPGPGGKYRLEPRMHTDYLAVRDKALEKCVPV